MKNVKLTVQKIKFELELRELILQKCDEINHYVAGCDSPFSYEQIRYIQECLNNIEETLRARGE